MEERIRNGQEEWDTLETTCGQVQVQRCDYCDTELIKRVFYHFTNKSII